jgi:hypothetical protein
VLLPVEYQCSHEIYVHFHARFYVSMPSAGIFKQSMGARNRVGIGLSYRPARIHSLTELFPGNRFLGSLRVKNSGSGHFYRWKCVSQSETGGYKEMSILADQ